MTSLSTLNLKYIKAVYSSVKSNKPNIKPNCQPVILSFFTVVDLSMEKQNQTKNKSYFISLVFFLQQNGLLNNWLYAKIFAAKTFLAKMLRQRCLQQKCHTQNYMKCELYLNF